MSNFERAPVAQAKEPISPIVQKEFSKTDSIENNKFFNKPEVKVVLPTSEDTSTTREELVSINEFKLFTDNLRTLESELVVAIDNQSIEIGKLVDRAIQIRDQVQAIETKANENTFSKEDLLRFLQIKNRLEEIVTHPEACSRRIKQEREADSKRENDNLLLLARQKASEEEAAKYSNISPEDMKKDLLMKKALNDLRQRIIAEYGVDPEKEDQEMGFGSKVKHFFSKFSKKGSLLDQYKKMQLEAIGDVTILSHEEKAELMKDIPLMGRAESLLRDAAAAVTPGVETVSEKQSREVREKQGETVHSRTRSGEEFEKDFLGIEAERIIEKQYTYKTFEGKHLCDVAVSMRPVYESEGLKSFLLLRLSLTYSDAEGNIQSYNVLDLANKTNACIFVRENEKRFSFSPKEKIVICPPLDTPLGLGILLHELGHAAQDNDPLFRKVEHLYGAEYQSKDAISTIRDNFTGFTPEIEKKIHDLESFAKYSEDFLEEHDQIKKQLQEMEEAIISLKNSKITKETQDKLSKLLEAHKILFDKNTNDLLDWSDKFKLYIDDATLKNIILLTKRVMERDATYRAFRWMRQIRDKTNINLFDALNPKQEKIHNNQNQTEESACIDSFLHTDSSSEVYADSEDTIFENLEHNLESYIASTKEMRKQFGNKIPFLRKK